jgi:hypothetical protein
VRLNTPRSTEVPAGGASRAEAACARRAASGDSGGRDGSAFSLRRTDSLPGRRVTDRQMRLYMNFRHDHSPAIAVAKAGFSTAAAYRFEKDPRLPTQKKAPRERRRADPFVGVWENEVLPMLKAAPGLRPVAVADRAMVMGRAIRCRRGKDRTPLARMLARVIGIVVVCPCRRGYHGCFRRKLSPSLTWFGGCN